jgi:hypothetical protein
VKHDGSVHKSENRRKDSGKQVTCPLIEQTALQKPTISFRIRIRSVEHARSRDGGRNPRLERRGSRDPIQALAHALDGNLPGIDAIPAQRKVNDRPDDMLPIGPHADTPLPLRPASKYRGAIRRFR